MDVSEIPTIRTPSREINWQKSERNREEAVTQRRDAQLQRQEAETQRQQAEAQRQQAEFQRDLARRAEAQVEVARKKLLSFEYGAAMRVAHQEWQDSKISEMKGILDQTDPTVRGWEWNYLKRISDSALLTLEGHTGRLSGAVYSPDGSRIATSSFDRTVKIWDAVSGRLQQTLNPHTDLIASITYNSDGSETLTASYDGTAKILDARTGEIRRTFDHN